MKLSNFLIAILISFSAVASTQQTMNQFLNELIELKKFQVSEDKFSDPKNAAEISEHLKKFSTAAKQAAHDPALKKENFKFSRQILQHHILEIEEVFRSGNKSYARWMLNSATSVCMSCHTQIPATSKIFSGYLDTKTFSSTFDQAEFLFATRFYEKAAELFDSQIKNYPQNGLQVNQLETSIKRQLAYLIRVKQNLTEAKSRLEEYTKIKELPVFLKKDMVDWREQLEKLLQRKAIKINDQNLQQTINENVKPLASDKNKLVNYLYISGLLFEYLNNNPKKKTTPMVLYWLAICDRAINNDFFYSLADLYLRECIIRYPENEMAAKCLEEYESETVFGYTGSSGTHIPEEVSEDLKNLKKLVQNKGKVDLQKK